MSHRFYANGHPSRNAVLIYFLCKVTPYKNVFMRPLHEHKVAFCHIENSIPIAQRKYQIEIKQGKETRRFTSLVTFKIKQKRVTLGLNLCS